MQIRVAAVLQREIYLSRKTDRSIIRNLLHCQFFFQRWSRFWSVDLSSTFLSILQARDFESIDLRIFDTWHRCPGMRFSWGCRPPYWAGPWSNSPHRPCSAKQTNNWKISSKLRKFLQSRHRSSRFNQPPFYRMDVFFSVPFSPSLDVFIMASPLPHLQSTFFLSHSLLISQIFSSYAWLFPFERGRPSPFLISLASQSSRKGVPFFLPVCLPNKFLICLHLYPMSTTNVFILPTFDIHFSLPFPNP